MRCALRLFLLCSVCLTQCEQRRVARREAETATTSGRGGGGEAAEPLARRPFPPSPEHRPDDKVCGMGWRGGGEGSKG